MLKRVCLLACVLPSALLPAAAGAATGEKLLHSFGSAHDGAFPLNNTLLRGRTGVYYGSASTGGASGLGVVFSLTPPAAGMKAWTYTVLHEFAAGEGTFPYGDMAFDSTGALIGSADAGGANDEGAVFRLAPPAKTGKPWVYRTLWSFGGANDGAAPYGGVTVGASDIVYGTTYEGGTGDFGIVFSLTPPAIAGGAWTETVLYRFSGGADGSGPVAAVTLGTGGAVYGTAESGGLFGITAGCAFPSGCGVVFGLVPTGGTWVYSVLHTFGGNPQDGATPSGGLLIGADGTLFGGASYGGADTRGFTDAGVMFALSPPAGGSGPWSYNVLKTMAQSPDFLSYPFGDLAVDASGVLTGAALDGGPVGVGGNPTHGGGIFTLTPPAVTGGAWTYAVKHVFTADTHDFCKTGCYPYAGPTLLPGGGSIGTTLEGGVYRPKGSKVGSGVIYELK